MAISSDDKTKLLKDIIGLFNAAPGNEFLPELEAAIEGGISVRQLTEVLATKSIFTDGVMGSATTSAEAAEILAGNFGLVADGVDGSPASQAIEYFTAGIDAGVNAGALVDDAVTFLMRSDLPAEFAATATLLENKALAASIYSESFGGTDLAALQAVLSAVTGDAPYTEADAIAALEAGGVVFPATFTMTAAADSLTEGSSLTYTVTASKEVTEDTTVVFTLLAGDSTAANQGTDTTNLNDFAAGAFNAVTVTIPAGSTTATFSVTAVNDALTELPENFSVQAVVNGQTLTTETVLVDSNIQTFSLTVGEDNLTGTDGDDLFLAPVVQDNAANAVNTLENIDILNGGTGTDTLTATLSGADAAPLLLSIENVNARFATANTLNLDNASGVSKIIVQQSTDTGTVSNIGNVATLGVKNQNQDVTFTGNTATSQNLIFDTVGASQDIGDQVTVDLDDGATTANITTKDANVAVGTLASVEDLSVAATGENRVNLAATQATVTDVTVTGEGSVDLTDAAFTAVETVDGTGNSGGLSIIVDDTAVTVDTGSGDDSVEYTAALAATAAVTLGAGDDTFTIAGPSVAGATVDGGDDNDTLAVTDGSWLDADAADVYSNFETLEVGGGTGTYDMENLPGLTAITAGAAFVAQVDITNAEAGTTVTVNAEGSTDLNLGFPLTYALKTATGDSDAVSLTLNAADGDDDGVAEGVITAPSFVANDIETFDIVSNVSDIDDELENTDYTNTITALDGDAVTHINVSGNANLDASGLAATTVTHIDAQAMTGALTINASTALSAVEFLGGSANDVYTGTDAGNTISGNGGADDITLGAVAAAVDTLIIAAGDSVLNEDADGHDMITNFGTGANPLDVIDVGAFGFTGQQASALANKGALANSAVDGSTLSVTDFFSSGGVDRGVAIGTNGGDTFVFIDANKDGDFTAADDVVAQLVAVTDATLANFGF